MEYIKSFLKIFGILLLGATLLLGAVYMTIRIKIVDPYYAFVEKEQALAPWFDTLNVEVESQLPPLPPEAKLKRRKLNGLEGDFIGYSLYGRWLTFEFSIPWSEDAVFSYYRSALVANGWVKNRQFSNFSLYSESYYRERSCISIDADSDLPSHPYTIRIWQDYKHQSFNPNLPEPGIVKLSHIENREAVCP